jgi:hypothetical protein
VLVLGSLLVGCGGEQAWVLWQRTGRNVRFDRWTKVSAHSTRADCIRRFPTRHDFTTETSWAVTFENKQSFFNRLDDGTVIESQYACWPAGVTPDD